MTKVRDVAAALGVLSLAALAGCTTSGTQRPAPQAAAQPSAQPTAQYSQAARPAAQELSPGMVQQVQASLHQHGLYNGGIDGIWGPATRAAVLSYQQSNGLKANGLLDSPTLASLDLPNDGSVPSSGSSSDQGAVPAPGFPDHPTGKTAPGPAAATQAPDSQSNQAAEPDPGFPDHPKPAGN